MGQMILGSSTHVFLPQRLHPGLLDALANGGAKTIEVFAARYHFDYADRAQVKEIAGWFRSNPVTASLHQPLTTETTFSRHAAMSLDLIDREKMHRIEAMDEVKRALEAAEQIPFESCVLHLGMKGDKWSEATLEFALTAVDHVKAFASPLGVKLLLENLQNEVATPEHLVDILRIGHFDSVGVCLDTGHAHLSEGGIAGAFEVLKGRVVEVHLHDNNGMRDEHLWPASGSERSVAAAKGSIDWAETYRLLDTLPAATRGVLEIGYEGFETAEAVSRMTGEVLSHRTRLLEEAAAFDEGQG
ncbi:sugar phosphate isomerase/epimerase family protein [Granulicella tundricola]|uniref:Xylose isomerase domain-containing protein TIM barrel n=1 Tax=Granulicella tundricola (strain ATCC BAA-1859 / DSM 23138 / MP5ACTX9) TaxID=1198114 RepID=E8WWS5_GRATM|nr:sugar phosphate isomerase/epimerase [Granulicella tundricola]ADW67403.1 Xylose isomerase domain-containing protein TIM barrel [Granulicella tundricola MP5ACTX9]